MIVDSRQLKTKWEIKSLGGIAEVQSGGTPLTSRNEYWSGDIPWYASGELNEMFTKTSKSFITQKGIEESNAKLFPKGSLLIGMYDTAALKMSILDRDATFNQAIAGVKPNKNIDLKFILYAIDYRRLEILNQRRGVRQKNLSLAKIKDISLSIPLVSEQKRIVAILDEAFEGCDRAIRNTEKNLANAREIFESYLQNLDAEKEPLGNLVDIKTGKLDANAATEDGQYPFFTCSREIYKIGSFAFNCEAILLAGNNAVGDFNVKHYKGKFNAYQRTYVITVNKENRILYRYLYFQMLKSLKEFKLQSVGTGTKFLKLGMIQGLQMALPSLEKQQEIILTLDKLESETQRLETIYRQKLAALKELKQSILQKAFTGELTADKEVA